MWFTSLCDRLSAMSITLFPLLLDAMLKSVAILSLTALAAFAMRRSSAAARHLVWFLGTLSLLILPILSTTLPAWRILPRWAITNTMPAKTQPAPAPSSTIVPAVSDTQLLPNYAPRVVVQMPFSIPPAPKFVTTPATSPLTLNWQAWIVLTWVTGIVLYLSYVLFGCLSLWRLQRRSSNVTDWLPLLGQACELLNFQRRVELISSARRTIPMTWGILRTWILVPADSAHWTIEQRRAVLLHELAHAKRLDCQTQIIAHFACALYWFNPLVWFARHRMQAEREQACDDLVLTTGTKASAYAEQLLQIATEMPSLRFSAAAIAMARPSKLEGRLLAILDVKRNRRALTWGGVILAVLFIGGFAIPLSILRAAEPQDLSKTNEATARPDAAPAATSRPVVAATAPRIRHFVQIVIAPDGAMTFQGIDTDWNKLPALLETVPDRSHTVLCLGVSSDDVTIGQFHEAMAQATELMRHFGFEYLSDNGTHPLGSSGRADKDLGKISDLVRSAVTTISTCADGDPKIAKAMGMLKDVDDSAVVTETAKYLTSDDDTTRRAAIYVLWRGNFESIDAALAPLIQACKHKEDLTRGMAALALGANHVGGGEASLIEMVTKDQSSYARRCAAYALGLLGEPDALPVLRKVAADPDPLVANNAKAAIRMLSSPTTQPSDEN